MVKVRVIQDGEIREVDAASGRELFKFENFGTDEELECAITPGMPSFLYSVAPKELCREGDPMARSLASYRRAEEVWADGP